MTDRNDVITKFLANTPWADAPRTPLAGDASMRKYQRLDANKAGQIAVLMDADPNLGNDVRPFLKITKYLRSIGLSAPEIYHSDIANGLLIIEDLGDALYARVVLEAPEQEIPLYQAATDTLFQLHKSPPPTLDPYDANLMTQMAGLAFNWYQLGASDGVDTAAKNAFKNKFMSLLDTEIDPPSVLIQRDYHAENLLWLPSRANNARVGLLDYQDALLGHPAYDLVSLLKDARRDVPQDIEEMMILRYVQISGTNDANFRNAYHLLGLQRNLRILGVFARLSMHFGKPSYIDLISRVWDHIQRDLKQPINAPLAAILNEALPIPTLDILQRLKDKCATVPTL
ncbi:phosphotransferase [Planktotalea sp.]|uniref:aminoglycoside phosphotransferase family protein n=1 Tax=Planktotalea sp. TaxID=2029877 RepID=UPI0025E10BCB|nr:phosphotransferase [Planktotalea sp.]